MITDVLNDGDVTIMIYEIECIPAHDSSIVLQVSSKRREACSTSLSTNAVVNKNCILFCLASGLQIRLILPGIQVADPANFSWHPGCRSG